MYEISKNKIISKFYFAEYLVENNLKADEAV